MAAINDLIAQIKDEALRQQIEAELKRVMKHKKFGLVFEDHLPEGLNDGPVYPGLEIIDSVSHRITKETKLFELSANSELSEHPERVGSPWHALIEADNYYALQLLAYLYPGQVDCIYIDPPYNTGARDWKYNNDYVDTADTYRHSKWLSMMKRRLLLAKRLLNPKDSVLIVTIDEKEYLHLGCLLEELFPEARMQMVTSVINPSGSSRKDLFARSDEYIYFLFFGEATIVRNQNDMLHPMEEKTARWDGLVRRGATGKRIARPNLFYPLFFSKIDGKFVDVGDPLPVSMNKNDVIPPKDCFALFPMSTNGEEATWGISHEKFKEKFEKGYIRFGKWQQGTEFRTVAHLQEGTIVAIERGEVEIEGKDEEGGLILGISNKPVTPMTTWVQQSHSAGDFGTRLLKNIFPTQRFSFPKSLYAVRDCIAFFVANKPNALIVDFFAGSGTTLHAVNLLNAEDGGHRRCIMVTNNEVSAEEAKSLTAQGFKPGDPEWEKLGIAQYVNWPRTVCSINGTDVNGQPLKGEYLGTDHRRMADGFDADCIFFRLKFLDKDNVATGKQFRELLPLLWMKSGARGTCPNLNNEIVPDMLVLPDNGFAVLNETPMFAEFMQQVQTNESIRDIYLVTDSTSMYREMTKTLVAAMPQRTLHTCQLYRDYLDNFRINTPRTIPS